MSDGSSRTADDRRDSALDAQAPTPPPEEAPLDARLIEHALEGLAVLGVIRSPEGAVTDFVWRRVNARAAALLGDADGEASWAGRRLLATLPESEGTPLFEQCARVAQSGAPERDERYRASPPLRGWVEVAVVPFERASEDPSRSGQGEVDAVAVTLRDVTDRYAWAEALRESTRRFRVVTEHIGDLVCLHEPDGTCVFASPSAEHVLGYPPEEIVGRRPFRLAHPDDTARMKRALGRVRSGERVTERIRLRHADGGYRHMETACRPIYDLDISDEASVPAGEPAEASTVHLLTSTRDVSERVRAEEDLERTNEQLRLRNRELQDFAHIASHDLQEPLRKVRSFAGLMREEYDEVVDETGRYYLERMQDGAERMANLISDLLSLARVTTRGHPFENIDLCEILDAVQADLGLRIEETGGRLDVGSLPALEGDPTQIRQLLQNLVGNALKFHREGVPPRVKVYGTREKSAPEAGERALSLEEAVDVCRLVVEDNGVGFEERFLDRIFTPLQRLHSRDTYEGTGIGLAVCRRIVERHDGRIFAESTPGEGSRFTVLLPAERPRPEA